MAGRGKIMKCSNCGKGTVFLQGIRSCTSKDTNGNPVEGRETVFKCNSCGEVHTSDELKYGKKKKEAVPVTKKSTKETKFSYKKKF